MVPIGGGGLLSGMGTAARALKPDIGLIGVQAELYPSMYALLKNLEMPCEGDTLAEGIAVKIPGAFTSEVIRELVDEIVLVSEAELETAVSLLLQIEKTVVEGAGAAGLAAVMANPEIFAGKNVGIVLCGGNIDTRLLANVLLRDLARSGRLARLRLTLQDRPGTGQITKMCNQIAFAGVIQSLSEALRFAQSAELDVEKVYEAISGGAAQSWQMDNRSHKGRGRG